MNSRARKQRYILFKIRKDPYLQLQCMAAVIAVGLCFLGGMRDAVLPALVWAGFWFAYRDRRLWLRVARTVFWYHPWTPRGTELAVLGCDYYYVHPFLVKSFLISRGIEAQILDEHMGSFRWKCARATGGVKILVEANDLERAMAAIRAVIAENEHTLIQCPKCTSTTTEYWEYRPGIAITTAALDVILPIPYRRHLCIKCRFQWKADQQQVKTPVVVDRGTRRN